MDESRKLALMDKAKKGELRDKFGNKLGADHPSLRKLFEEENSTKTNNSKELNELTEAISLINKTLEDTKRAQEETAKTLLASQRVITTSTEKQSKDLLDAINQNKQIISEVPTIIPIAPKELEQWEFMHKRDTNGKLISTVAKQIR